MKKISFAFASIAFVLAATPSIMVAPAHAAANPNVGVCKDAMAAGFIDEITLGQCISTLTIEDNYFGKGTGNKQAIAVHECQWWKASDPVGYDSMFASDKECRELILSFL